MLWIHYIGVYECTNFFFNQTLPSDYQELQIDKPSHLRLQSIKPIIAMYSVDEMFLQKMLYELKGTDAMSQLSYNIDVLKNASSGMLRRVALVRTDVSEELGASFIG
jgi:hypothetical protein